MAEDLTRARAEEAARRPADEWVKLPADKRRDIALIAAEQAITLDHTQWRPPEPVDPDIHAAREVLLEVDIQAPAEDVRAGLYDKSLLHILTALKRGRTLEREAIFAGVPSINELVGILLRPSSKYSPGFAAKEILRVCGLPVKEG